MRHHLILFLPVLVTAGYVGWICATPSSVPAPVTVAMLILGPSAFVAVGVLHRWRARRQAANSRSLFGR